MDHLLTSTFGGTESSDYTNFTQMVNYLLVNIERAPFNLEHIARELNLDLAVINQYFDLLKKVFRLQKNIESRQQWGNIVCEIPDSMLHIRNTSDSAKDSIKDFVKNSINNSVKDSVNGSNSCYDNGSGNRTRISPGDPIAFRIKESNLDTLNHFNIITRNNPIKKKILMGRMKLKMLYKELPLFFKETKNGISISELGDFVCKEYISFRKLNTEPESIKYGNITFVIER